MLICAHVRSLYFCWWLFAAGFAYVNHLTNASLFLALSLSRSLRDTSFGQSLCVETRRE